MGATALAAAAGLGLLWLSRRTWLSWIGRSLVVADPLAPADAVVPLGGGGAERVAHAAALLQEGYAAWLATADGPVNLPGIRASYAELVREEAVAQGVPGERVVAAPGAVRTTYEEAIAIRRLAQARGWRSLIAVTDPYHTRRARRILRQALQGTGIGAIVRPAPGHGYRVDGWWKSAIGVRETATEYIKWGMYLVGYR